MTELEALGRALREGQESVLESRHDLSRAREQVLRASSNRSGRSAKRVWLAAAIVPVLLVVVVVWFGWIGQSGPLTFELADGSRGRENVWLATLGGAERSLRFADGSTVLLRAKTRARVTSLSRDGAHVVMERGEAAVAVVPRPNAQWSFAVGPFDLQVTGTRFDVGWLPVDQRFSLRMQEGSVEIRGPGVEGVRPVVAGERVEIVLSDSDRTAHSSNLERRDPGPAALSSASGDRSAAPTESQVSSARGKAPTRAMPTWQELSAAGEFRDAMAAAEAAGFDSLAGRLGAADLMTLGNTARYAGNSARAGQAYRALRARHGGTPQAAVAAFYLGRITFPSSGAANFFQAYLREQPGGALSREALGRLLELRHRSGSAGEARRLARQYLAAFPGGPHAPLARKLAGE